MGGEWLLLWRQNGDAGSKDILRGFGPIKSAKIVWTATSAYGVLKEYTTELYGQSLDTCEPPSSGHSENPPQESNDPQSPLPATDG